MSTPRWGICITLTCLVVGSVCGQVGVLAPEDAAALRTPPITPTRLLAGMRMYAEPVIGALVQGARDPDALRNAAQTLQSGREPLPEGAAVSIESRQAIELLSRSPDLLLLAADHPDELRTLEVLWSVAPDGVTLRIEQLRSAYTRAASAGAASWQQTIEQDPVALGEYRDLLTRFCRTMRQEVPEFACVRVTDRSYYYACPPTEDLVAFMNEAGFSPALGRVAAAWWSEFSPQVVDSRLEQMRGFALADAGAVPSIHDIPAEQRKVMWQRAEGNDLGGALGLMPVAMQPLADQPADARVAFAVFEHARLWSPPVPPLELSAPVDELEPTGGIVIAETIPGPLTQREHEWLETELAYDTPREYAVPSYVGSYGYAGYSPYYSGNVYWRDTVFYPYRGYCSDPYQSINVYHYDRDHWYGRSPRGHVRIHYGGGRHYGNTRDHDRDRQRQPRLYIDRRYRDQVSHSSRPVEVSRRVIGRSSRGSVGCVRGGASLRPGHSGVYNGRQPTIRTGSRPTIRSGSRPTIRSGSRPTIRSGSRPTIRSGSRPTIRSGSRPTIRSGSRPAIRTGSRPVIRSGGRSTKARLQDQHNRGPRRSGSDSAKRPSSRKTTTKRR